MSKETDIQRDIRALITAEVAGVGVYDNWSQPDDALPYVVFGPTQRVRNHAKEWRGSIYHVKLHLWSRDTTGSIAARNMASDIVDALDMQRLTISQLDCYFTELLPLYEDDEVTSHIVLSFEVR